MIKHPVFLQKAASNGFTADKWINSIIKLLNGKGGGKKECAQASGKNYTQIDELIKLAHDFASQHLQSDSPGNQNSTP